MPPTRLITKPFLAVTAAAAAFFVYVGILVPIIPTFVDDELAAGEFGVGLSLAAFAAAAICARPVIGRLVERFGRRSMMIAGSLLAGVAGMAMASVGELWQLLALRGVAGVGDAALFVGAATLIADLSPPDRRAEAASYFSVAVFAGLGMGPLIGDILLGDDQFDRAFVIAGSFALLAALLALAVPRAITPHVSVDHTTDVPVRRGFERIMHPAAVGPGLVLACGIAGFAVFSAFLPEHARDVGLGGSGALFAGYSVVCLVLRFAGAKWLERLGVRRAVSIAFVALSTALACLALFPDVWALWLAAGLIGVASAFLYPSLMALTVNRADDRERPMALSSFTMFFEVGNISGGVAFGLIAQLASKRAAFGSAIVLCGLGAWLLLARVVPAAAAARRPAPTLTPVAVD
jgi:MFS family permease